MFSTKYYEVSKKYFFIKLFLLTFLFLTFIAYIVKPFNFEITIVVMGFVCLAYLIKNYKSLVLDFPIVIFIVFIFIFWFVNVLLLIFHGVETPRSVSILRSHNNILTLIFIIIALWMIRPSLNFFWYLISFGSLVIIGLYFLELSVVGFDSLGAGLRLGGAYSHPVKFGYYTLTFLIIQMGSFYWAYTKGKLHLLLSILIALVLLWILISSQTRSSWLGLPESILVWALYYIYLLVNRFKVRKYHAFIYVLFSIFSLAAFISITPARDVVYDRVTSAVSDIDLYLKRESFQTSVGYRLLGYEAAYYGIKENFFLGVGEDGFIEAQKKYTGRVAWERFQFKFEGTEFIHIHNQFLMTWWTRGFLSFLVLSFFFLYLFIFFSKKAVIYKNLKDYSALPISLSGLLFVLASFLAFQPDVFLQRGDTTFHFFFIMSLLYVFVLLSGGKHSCKENFEKLEL